MKNNNDTRQNNNKQAQNVANKMAHKVMDKIAKISGVNEKIIVTVKTETETAMEETERIIRRNIQINQSVLYLSAD